MARWRWVVLLFACLIALGSGPALALAAPGNGRDEPDTDVRACDATPAPGFARCHARVRTDAKVKGKAPAANVVATPDVLGNNGAYDPGFLQAAYNLAGPAASSGGGRTVAIVDAYDNPNAERDLGTYRSQFGLPACTTTNGCFRKVNQTGGTTYPAADTGWGQEIALDLDMVSAICPNCTILLVEANSANFDDLAVAVDYAASVPGVIAISNSYGAGEWGGTAYYNTHYTHPGIAITASTGDGGYEVQYPASAPYVTAVGGTTLNQASNTGGRNATETAWSGAGSGCSNETAKPTWQTDAGCTTKAVADVSAVADPSTGVWVYDTYNAGGWLVFGGTSAAAPIVAATYALAGNPGQNPAASPYAPGASLFDIVSGSNGTCTTAYFCTSGPGYDGPTGLGTPNGVTAFRAGPVPDFAVAATPPNASVKRGGSAAYTVTLTGQNGYANAVQLAVTNLPAKVTATFSPNPVTLSATTATATTTLRITTGTGAIRGTYPLTITATGKDGTKHTTTVQLTIQ